VKQFNAASFDQSRFMREVQTLAQLNHPCVLRIVGWAPPIGREPAQIRTEIAENGSLKDILEKVRCETRFPFWNPTGKAILICGIALGMRFVHSKGIIHGDLKPSNILLNDRGEPLMSDFGSSRFESNDYTLTQTDGTVYASNHLVYGRCRENRLCSPCRVLF
jgi:abelson tyrosine-protein kinase 1/abelson tyrosine-protein kinase 2